MTLVLLVWSGVVLAQSSTDTSAEQNPVRSCNQVGHAQCIKLTAREVFEDGTEGKWSEHWKSMSYIGRACVSEKGERKGKAIEALFAPPHYIAMFFVNISGLIKHLFSKKESGHIEERDN